MVAWAFDGATGMQANKADRVTATIEERIRIGESSEYAASWDWLAREREVYLVATEQSIGRGEADSLTGMTSKKNKGER
jgi:hypothetical protein